MKLTNPRFIQAIFLFAFVVNLIILFVGAVVVGISWDERLQLEMTGNWKKYGTFQLTQIEGFAYGPVAAAYSHAIAVLLGAEVLGVASFSVEAYAARHISVAILATIGAFAVGAIVWLVSRSMNASLLGSVLVMSIPMWVGHGMFNPKDIAVATGYTLITAGAASIIFATLERTRSLYVYGALSLFLGIGLSGGTRTVLVFVALATILLGGMVLSAVSRDQSALRSYFFTSSISLISGYAALTMIYPAVFLRPTNLLSAMSTSAEFPWRGETLVAGMLVDASSPPWYYLPAWFSAQMPIFIQVVFWGGLVAIGFVALRESSKTSVLANQRILIGTVLLLSQAFALPGAAIVLRSTLYDGVRHFLFVVPAVAAVGAIGVWLFVTSVRKAFTARLVMGAVAIGFGASLLAQIQLFPYSYTYFNPVASIAGVDDNWPTDYWRTSGRELIPKIPLGPVIACSEWSENQEPEPCDRQHQYAPYWESLGTLAEKTIKDDGSSYLLVRANRGNTRPPENCELIDAVTRSPWGLSQTMSWVAECPKPLDRRG